MDRWYMHITQNLKDQKGIQWKYSCYAYPSATHFPSPVTTPVIMFLGITLHPLNLHAVNTRITHTTPWQGRNLLFSECHKNNASYDKIQIVWEDINYRIKTSKILLLEENSLNHVFFSASNVLHTLNKMNRLRFLDSSNLDRIQWLSIIKCFSEINLNWWM